MWQERTTGTPVVVLGGQECDQRRGAVENRGTFQPPFTECGTLVKEVRDEGLTSREEPTRMAALGLFGNLEDGA